MRRKQSKMPRIVTWPMLYLNRDWFIKWGDMSWVVFWHFSPLMELIGHFRVPPGLLYQNEVKWSAFDMDKFFILKQIKLIFTRKVAHLTSFWKWEFLELGSGLFMLGYQSGHWMTDKFYEDLRKGRDLLQTVKTY